MESTIQTKGPRLAGLLQFPAGARSPAAAKLSWLVRLRWAALVVAFLFAAPAVYSGLLPRDNLLFFIGILTCAGLFNLFSQIALHERIVRPSHALVTVQLVFDLCALSAALRLMGGLANPIAMLFYLHVVLGGFLLPRGRAWPYLICLHLILAWLQVSSFLVPIAQQNLPWLFLPHAMVIIFWHTVHFLGRHLDLQHRLLLSTSVAAEKQDRLRALGALSAGFSHEFASPLQTLRLRLDRIARQTGPTPDIEAAREALADCTRVLHAMNQSQLDARSAEPAILNLSTLTEEIVRRWENENCAVERSLPGNLPAKIPAVSYAQTLLNLLDNAREAGGGGRITLILRAEEDRVHLSVADEGPGFSRAVLDRLGEPFNTSKPMGTGLGLYVAELFAQGQGGSLSARNLNPRGAVVSLNFPAGDAS